ncbi:MULTISPECIES: glycerate kinase [unclassified Cetobacterium]|uniref:glycerate kinase family protein n=1 Tax=unclassified Cetobacterium TaxID=2630983 RepID=UPI0009E08C7B|nr:MULTISPECIES: glycerate kinase [unclassified Cetobacterium]
MKVLVAIDSFKGSLSSLELGEAIEEGIKKVYIDAEVTKIPIADGGEGTVVSLVEGTNGEFVSLKVNNPLMEKIEARYGIMGDKKTAVIEMAEASGLTLVPIQKRNPMKTTTYGTGELIKNAIEKGCREFIIGIGGSATNDAGLGMLQALGYKFLDKDKVELGFGGEILSKVKYIDSSEAISELKKCKFLIACDVDNTFYGENGAAEIYSRQKGATEEMVKKLDKGLKHLAEVIKKEIKIDISNLSGAGAAGGLGGGLVAFLNGKLSPGIEIVLEKVGIENKIQDVDFVITGEGRLDNQTAMGKAPIGVAKIAKKFDVPVIAIAGGVTEDAWKTHEKGIDSFFSVINYPITLKEAMRKENAHKFVKSNIEEIFRLIKVCEKKNFYKNILKNKTKKFSTKELFDLIIFTLEDKKN